MQSPSNKSAKYFSRKRTNTEPTANLQWSHGAEKVYQAADEKTEMTTKKGGDILIKKHGMRCFLPYAEENKPIEINIIDTMFVCISVYVREFMYICNENKT